ncbi:MAG: hypothetical protein ABS55_04540 [Lautropia sp. SCN 70-15]|nr:MAG: hypothetical protein ABS55_04540 [Lautropia sp. SCN 70-15]
MKTAPAESVPERIRRLGFRRWHERTLIVAHGWLVGCFVAMIFVATGFELLSLGDGLPEFLFDALLIAAAATLGWQAWRRYRVSMALAASVSEQAACARCLRYGFRVADAPSDRLRAVCPRCGAQWWIELAGPGRDG